MSIDDNPTRMNQKWNKQRAYFGLPFYKSESDYDDKETQYSGSYIIPAIDGSARNACGSSG